MYEFEKVFTHVDVLSNSSHQILKKNKLRSDYDALKYQFDATIEKKNTMSNQFKELGKKYLYMVEYSGEQMYNE